MIKKKKHYLHCNDSEVGVYKKREKRLPSDVL